MHFPAELHVSFSSLLSFHIMISSTLYTSSLNFEHIPIKGELSAGIGYGLFSNKRKGCDGSPCTIADATWNIKMKNRKVMHHSQRAKMRHRQERWASEIIIWIPLPWQVHLPALTILLHPCGGVFTFKLWAMEGVAKECYNDSKGKEGRSESKEAYALSSSTSQAHSSMAVSGWAALW